MNIPMMNLSVWKKIKKSEVLATSKGAYIEIPCHIEELVSLKRPRGFLGLPHKPTQGELCPQPVRETPKVQS